MRAPRIIGYCFTVLAVLMCVPAGASATLFQPSIDVTQSRGTSALTEGDAGYAVSISLSHDPAADVVVTLDGAGLVASPSTLTFTAGSGRVPQLVVITAVEDLDPNDGETRTLVATSSSTDAPFDDLTEDIDVLVLDDDAVALHVDETGDGTSVVEAGAVDTVHVRLGTRPRQPVTVFLEGAGIVASPDMVVVRPEQWNLGIPVTIAALDDAIAQDARTSTLTARTVAPDAIWNGLTWSTSVAIDDDDVRRIRESGPVVPPEVPKSFANRTPSAADITLPLVWTGTGNVVPRFQSTDADNDPMRYRVFVRTFAYGARAPKPWKVATESTATTFNSGPIKPFEQRCFQVQTIDPHGATASSGVSCTHGLADDASVAATYGWKSTRLRGAWNGGISQPSKRARLLYFTHTGSQAVLTFIRCRTCASIRMVDPDGTNRIISLRGTGRREVTVPLNASGRRIWGFYVQGSGTVQLDSFAVLRPT